MDKMYYDGRSNVEHWMEIAGIHETNNILIHSFHNRYWTYQEVEQLPRFDSADHIFILGQESEIEDWVDRDHRIHVWDGLVRPDKERFYSYFWWWEHVLEVNKFQKFTNNLDNPLVSKPTLRYDALLGGKRVHREFLYNRLTNDPDTKNAGIISYGGIWKTGTDIDIMETATNNQTRSVRTKKYYNKDSKANIGVFVPFKIYNQCWFSILSETHHDRNFFTEKTGKAFLAKRLFVLFGAQGALRDLHHIGLKTFDSVIDESYDAEPNDEKRWSMAFEQVKFLCTQNPVDIYQKILPVLEYNQKWMLRYDPAGDMMAKIRNILGLYVPDGITFSRLVDLKTPPWEDF